MMNIKKNFEENKKLYIGIVVGLSVGGAVVFVAFKTNSINIVAHGDGNQIVGKAREVNQTIINMIERSTPSKPVHLKGTNLFFNSLSEAARETGHSLSKISRNVNGHIPDINGDVFELLELVT